eukprot:4287226-Prymnesium_polylepis.1
MDDHARVREPDGQATSARRSWALQRSRMARTQAMSACSNLGRRRTVSSRGCASGPCVRGGGSVGDPVTVQAAGAAAAAHRGAAAQQRGASLDYLSGTPSAPPSTNYESSGDTMRACRKPFSHVPPKRGAALHSTLDPHDHE